jgi:hypothetical protein
MCTSANSLRYRLTKNAASNGSGRVPPLRFVDAKSSVRKYSTLSGSMCPCTEARPPGVPEPVRLSRLKGDRFARLSELWGFSELLVADTPLLDGLASTW